MRIFLLLLLISSFAHAQQTIGFLSDTACYGQLSSMFSLAYPTDSVVSYEWDFDGDSDFSDGSGQNVNYLFPSHGLFTVAHRVTFNDGEILTIQETVKVNQVLTPNITWERGCEGSEINYLGVFAEIYSLGVDYNWDMNEDNIFDDASGDSVYYTFNNFGIKDIKLQVETAEGCASIVTDQIVIDPRPNSELSIEKNCYGDSTTFTQLSTIPSGSIDLFSWDVNGDADFSELNGEQVKYQYFSPGNYSISLLSTSNYGCTDIDTLFFSVFPRPQASFTVQDECEEIEVDFDNLSNLDVGQLSYSWSFGDGDSSFVEHPVKQFQDPGVYSVELLVESSFGCSDSVIKEIEIHQKPNSEFTISDLCFGDITNIENTSTTNSGIVVSYLWDFGDNLGSVSFSPDHQYSSPGTYEVKLIIEDSYGCRDTSNITIDVIENPSISIFNHDEMWYCEKDSVWLEVYPDDEDMVLWSNGTFENSAFFNYPGMHYVTVYDSFGCFSKDSILIEEIELPIVDAGVDFSMNAGEQIFLNGSGTFYPEWIQGDFIDNPNDWKPTARPAESGAYVLQAINDYGCLNLDTVFVTVDREYVLDPTNLFSPNGDGNNDSWIVRNISAYEDCEVVIYNRWGQEVYRSLPYANDWDGSYNGQNLPEGAYYYTIKCKDSVKVYTGDISLIRSNE